MVGWHHQLNGHEFEQALGVGDRQRILACYSPWHHKELDMSGQLSKNNFRNGVKNGGRSQGKSFGENNKF